MDVSEDGVACFVPEDRICICHIDPNPNLAAVVQMELMVTDVRILCLDGELEEKVHQDIVFILNKYGLLNEHGLFWAKVGFRKAQMALLVEYMHTGQVNLDQEALTEMLQSDAPSQEFAFVLHHIFLFVKANQRPDVTLDMWRLCWKVLCFNSKEALVKLLCRDFAVLEMEKLWGLDAEQLEKIICRDELDVSEVDLLSWLVEWAESSPGRLEADLARLLSHVRVYYMTVEDFIWAEQRLNAISADLVSELYNASHERPSRISSQVILAFGGWIKEPNWPCNHIEVYNFRSGEWRRAQWFNADPRMDHGMAVVDNLICLFGGFDGARVLRTTDLINLKSLERLVAPDMSEKRCYVASAVVDGKVYAIGGFNGSEWLKSAEWLEPHTRVWTPVENVMPVPRCDSAAVAVDHQIFVMGGFDGQSAVASTDILDTRTGTWSPGPTMKKPRYGHKAVLVGSKIFIFGGKNSRRVFRSVECLDLSDTNAAWSYKASMIVPRSHFALSCLGDTVVVAGGCNLTLTDSVDIYSSEKDTWTEGHPLTEVKSGLNCILIDHFYFDLKISSS